MIALRDHQAYLADDLALAAAAVRMHRADDITWRFHGRRPEVIDSCTDVVSAHAGRNPFDADRLLERFGEARFVRLGAISGLARHPPSADAAAADREARL